MDPRVHEALERWARDELRSVNAQIEFALRRALQETGRLPADRRTGGRDGEESAERRNGGTAEDNH
jgi:hypothetical protein